MNCELIILIFIYNMTFWIIKNILLSIIFIYLVHSIILFLMNLLTVPKTKDMVQITNNNYKNIYDMLANEKIQEGLTPIDSLPNSNATTLNPSNLNINESQDIDIMKHELTNYIREQLNVLKYKMQI